MREQKDIVSERVIGKLEQEYTHFEKGESSKHSTSAVQL